MEVTTDQVIQNCMNTFTDNLRNLPKINIMVVGKSGVGKSTLINSVFRGDLAEVGIGERVTQKICRYGKADFPLTIYDTPGFELSEAQQKRIKEEIYDTIRKGYASDDRIHCLWYCINSQAGRMDSVEIQWIEEFTAHGQNDIPVFIILTRATDKKQTTELKNFIESKNLNIKKVLPVLAQDMKSGGHTVKHHGLDTLIDVMGECIPAELSNSLQNVQKVSLKSKRMAAQKIVTSSVMASVAAGAVPIPIPDAPILLTNEINMISKITVVFGFDFNTAFLTAFVSSTMGGTGATVLGKTAVTSILKCIPGVGSLLGGTISGGIAGVITAALGEAYICIMEMLYKGEITKDELCSDKGQKKMQKIFQNELKIMSKRKTKIETEQTVYE